MTGFVGIASRPLTNSSQVNSICMRAIYLPRLICIYVLRVRFILFVSLKKDLIDKSMY